MSLFEDIAHEIENEYSDKGYQLGWRFLNSSNKVLDHNSGIALITLNPGGSSINPEHGVASCESGHSYLYETWKDGKSPGDSPLQTQFQLFFQKCADYSGFSYPEILEESICGYFIPFRSPTYKVLNNRKWALDFSSSIWNRILRMTMPKIVFCIDNNTYKYLHRLIEDIYGREILHKKYLIGWGSYEATISEFPYVKLIRFPHLSRFRIFGRGISTPFIDQIFQDIFT